MEEIQIPHHNADGEGRSDAAEQCASCALGLARADILRDECGHRLHIGRRHQHHEPAQALGDTDARRGDQAEGVDDRGDDEERDGNQQILQRDRDAQTQDLTDIRAVWPDIAHGEGEGEPAAADDEQRQHDADRLRRDRGDRRAGGAEAEDRDEQKIARNVQNAGKGDGQKRHFRVADAAENTADQVIGDDEHRAAGADRDIADGAGEGLLRRAHHAREGIGGKEHDDARRDREHGEEPDAGADDLSRVLALACADPAPDEHGQTHRKAHDDDRDRVHDLRAGRDGGDVRGACKLPDNEQIDRAVHRL